jgi:phage terminase small subunit
MPKSKKEIESGLSDRQLKFCQEYVIDLNGSAAAVRSGYSAKTAKEQASELLTRPNIKAKVAELQANMAERTQITADMVLKELWSVASSNVQDHIGSLNQVTDISKIDRNKAAAISRVKVTTRSKGDEVIQTVETAFHDKVKALELCGRHLGIFEKDNAQQGMPILIVPNIQE